MAKGRYSGYGGAYMPELLMAPLEDLLKSWENAWKSAKFRNEFYHVLSQFGGRPTPLTEAHRLSSHLKRGRIFLKREDLLHTGAHKLNNALGQCMLAMEMGKRRIIAETGAGQHGVATAAAAAHLGLECVIYMGSTDIKRQAPNVKRMRLMGAEVRSVDQGSKTLKDAINQALRDWSESYEYSHYCLGSALGPHPYPEMVREFQKIIGIETQSQIRQAIGKDPDLIVACVGGGSNSIGIFTPFLENREVKLVGVEAGGTGITEGRHAARFAGGKPGVLHACFTYLLQDQEGQILPTHSVSAGLDYPAVGPEHVALYESGRVSYTYATDEEAINAFLLLSKLEGIIPALESSHAIAYLMREPFDGDVVVNLSGRGDKDLDEFFRYLERERGIT